jgi:hypothetical protein
LQTYEKEKEKHLSAGEARVNKAMRGGITPRLLTKDEARKKIREEEEKIREVLSIHLEC